MDVAARLRSPHNGTAMPAIACMGVAPVAVVALVCVMAAMADR